MEYKLITGRQGEVESGVNKYLRGGWKLHGSTTVTVISKTDYEEDKVVYSQPMVLKKSKNKLAKKDVKC